MLKGIPKSFTADMLRLIMELGHGEDLLICDANYPYKSKNKDTVFIPNITISDLLEDLLLFFPLDHAVEKPAVVMSGAINDGIAAKYDAIIAKHLKPDAIEGVGRFDFYDLSETCSGIIVTTDNTKFANILLKKGIVLA